MKKIVPFLVVFVLVLSIIGIAKVNPVWASPKADTSEKSPLLTLKTITENGVNNIGGVCTIEVNFKVPGVKLLADADVSVLESKKVPFTPIKDPNFSDEALLFPGCHFVHYKLDETNTYKIVNPMKIEDGSAKVCFGNTPTMFMQIYYYLDSPLGGYRVWIPVPTTLEDKDRLICAPALFTGVYMPSGRYPIIPVSGEGGGGGGTQTGPGGTVITPTKQVKIAASGTYAVGGICILEAKYKIAGLSDTVDVEYAEDHLTADNISVSADGVDGLFYFPGCHVLHYLNHKIIAQVTPAQGDWKICFAAVPEKVMTIYYYQDNLSKIISPWKPLVTVTDKGMACADLVDWSGVYTPAGK